MKPIATMNETEYLHNFIVFEGLDGAGTTTQTGLFQKRCDAAGLQAVSTAEPTAGHLGKTIRSFLKGSEIFTPSTAAYLFAADRNEHLYGAAGIVQMLNSGKIVLSDRYFFSSLAYQGVGVDYDLVKKLNSAFPLPEFLFFLEVSPEIGETRLAGRGGREIYEYLDFQRKVHANYRRILTEYSSASMRVLLLDGTRSPEDLSKEIWSFYLSFR